jgi:hypothetical protein
VQWVGGHPDFGSRDGEIGFLEYFLETVAETFGQGSAAAEDYRERAFLFG